MQEWMNVRKKEQTNKTTQTKNAQTNELINLFGVCRNDWMDERTNEGMNEKSDGWTDERTGERTNDWKKTGKQTNK